MALSSRASLAVAIALASAVACSTTYSSTGNNASDASTASDANPNTKNDGASLAPDGGSGDDGGANADPCVNQAPSYEYAGLYVLGGESETDVDGGYTEPQDILRAPIHCDGSLGAWVVASKMPSPNAGQSMDGRTTPIVGTYAGHIILFGGLTSLGGPPLTTGIVDWTVLPGGMLSAPVITQDAVNHTEVWRAPFTMIGSTLIVAGGEGAADGGADVPRTEVDLWDLAAQTPGTFGAPDPLPQPIFRAGAAAIGNDIYAFGGSGNGGAVYTGTLAADGTLHWMQAGMHNDFDFSIAAYGSSIYVVGGDNAENVLTLYPVEADKTLGVPSTVSMPNRIALSCVSVSRGFLYTMGSSIDSQTVVLSAPLTAGGIGSFTTEPDLPEDRFSCASVVVLVQ